MIENVKKQKIYVVISQTGTLPSKIIKKFTGAEYNHSSISLDSELKTMYSFARKFTYNPFWAGFVVESPNEGTFKRFSETKVVVLSIQVDEKQYKEIKRFLQEMYHNRNNYHYNYCGLMFAAFGICYRKRNHYYCSEFIKELLMRFKIARKEQFADITKPMDFLNSLDGKIVYCGKLRNYCIDSCTA